MEGVVGVLCGGVFVVLVCEAFLRSSHEENSGCMMTRVGFISVWVRELRKMEGFRFVTAIQHCMRGVGRWKTAEIVCARAYHILGQDCLRVTWDETFVIHLSTIAIVTGHCCHSKPTDMPVVANTLTLPVARLLDALLHRQRRPLHGPSVDREVLSVAIL